MKDLWPSDIAVHRVKSPVGILREQASLLGKKTNNIVQAEVQILDSIADLFGSALFIVAPALSNYRYRLLLVWHKIELYPAQIFVEDEILSELSPNVEIKLEYPEYAREPEQYIAIDSEEQFLNSLEMIFGSNKTRRVITALLSQSDPTWEPLTKADEDDIPF